MLSLGGVVALPRSCVPGKCWQGYFIDTEGNTFGIFEVDEQARARGARTGRLAISIS